MNNGTQDKVRLNLRLHLQCPPRLLGLLLVQRSTHGARLLCERSRHEVAQRDFRPGQRILLPSPLPLRAPTGNNQAIKVSRRERLGMDSPAPNIRRPLSKRIDTGRPSYPPPWCILLDDGEGSLHRRGRYTRVISFEFMEYPAFLLCYIQDEDFRTNEAKKSLRHTHWD